MNLGLVAAFLTVCNQIRSLGVRFGKRAVVGAVRVFGPAPDYVFLCRVSSSVAHSSCAMIPRSFYPSS
jgi:hypothetical protein